MLGKLIKHEFRATARLMLPLALVVLLLSCFTWLSSAILQGRSYAPFILRLINGLLTSGFVLSLIVAVVFSVVMMVSRFYKNLMTDEGYLMFTLPVSIHQILWSKLIVATVWFIAVFCVDALGIFIVSYHGGMFREFFSGMQEIFGALNHYYGFSGIACVLEILVLLLVSLIVSCLNFYAPIAVGHSFSGHKILLSVVFYFAFGIVWQIVGMTSMFGGIDLLSTESFFAVESAAKLLSYVHYGLLSAIGAVALSGVVMYIITWRMLKRHLNLQ